MKRNELLYRARVPCPTQPSAAPCDAATRLPRERVRLARSD